MIHVVGAGLAGLAAALRLARAGHAVTLHEASPQFGGRARALPDGTDNGTHVLLGANRVALRFLDAVGARGHWVEPEPDGLPVIDLERGTARRVSLSPAGWRRAALRPEGLGGRGLLSLLRLAMPGPDRTVAEALGPHPALLRGFVDPLTVAALNTPASDASSRVLSAVLRRIALPGSTRLLVARRGLGPDMVDPAVAALGSLGAGMRRSRLREIVVEDGRAAVLRFNEAEAALAPGDAVVLATPPWESARLLPGLPVPREHAPIVNLHFAREAAPDGTPDGKPAGGLAEALAGGPDAPLRFVGVLGGLCQWVLVRPGLVSVTVSAASAEMHEGAEAMGPRAWAEIRRAAAAFDLPGPWPEAMPPMQLVKERRATPRHLPGERALPPPLPLSNLAIAGDWTDPVLPATLDAAVRSGEAAAALLMRRAARSLA